MTRNHTSSGGSCALEHLRAKAKRIGSLHEDHIQIPGHGCELTIVRPGDTDALLDLVADDPEQNLPYWAEIWPSGVALAEAILANPGVVRGKRTLELGVGIGVTAIAASSAGASLLAVDYAPEALTLCRLNTLLNAGLQLETLQVNWRQPNAEFEEGIADGFPVVLAADVLYERRDVAPLLTLVERLVAPGGTLWLAHPRRLPALQFVETLLALGWSGPRQCHTGPWPDKKDDGVVVDVHRLRRKGGESLVMEHA